MGGGIPFGFRAQYVVTEPCGTGLDLSNYLPNTFVVLIRCFATLSEDLIDSDSDEDDTQKDVLSGKAARQEIYYELNLHIAMHHYNITVHMSSFIPIPINSVMQFERRSARNRQQHVLKHGAQRAHMAIQYVITFTEISVLRPKTVFTVLISLL